MPSVTSIERMGRVEAFRETVLENLTVRFGEVPLEVQEHLKRLSDEAKLKTLHRFAVTCASRADFERALPT